MDAVHRLQRSRQSGFGRDGLRPNQFDFDQTHLTPHSARVLERIGGFNGGKKFGVEGYSTYYTLDRAHFDRDLLAVSMNVLPTGQFLPLSLLRLLHTQLRLDDSQYN